LEAHAAETPDGSACKAGKGVDDLAEHWIYRIWVVFKAMPQQRVNTAVLGKVEVSLKFIVTATIDRNPSEDIAGGPVGPEQDHRNTINSPCECCSAKAVGLKFAIPDSALYLNMCSKRRLPGAFQGCMWVKSFAVIHRKLSERQDLTFGQSKSSACCNDSIWSSRSDS